MGFFDVIGYLEKGRLRFSTPISRSVISAIRWCYNEAGGALLALGKVV